MLRWEAMLGSLMNANTDEAMQDWLGRFDKESMAACADKLEEIIAKATTEGKAQTAEFLQEKLDLIRQYLST